MGVGLGFVPQPNLRSTLMLKFAPMGQAPSFNLKGVIASIFNMNCPINLEMEN